MMRILISCKPPYHFFTRFRRIFEGVNVVMTRPRAVSALVLCLLVLSGCAQVPMRTAWALKDVDYLTVEPEQVRLALSLPAGAKLDKASLNLSFSREGITELEHQIAFEILTSGAEVERVGFPPGTRNGIVLRMPAAHIQEVVAYQQALRSARENRLPASATMGVDSRLNQAWVAQYCAAGNTSFTVQAWVMVEESEGYLALIGESEITRLLDAQSNNFCPQS